MDKKQLLIEKYGLSEDVAMKVVRMFKEEILLRDDTFRPVSNPKKNEAALKKVKTAIPDWCKSSPNVYGIKYPITKIDFVVNGQTTTIDDLALIEQIRQLIEKNEFEVTPKYTKKTTRKYQKRIAKYIFDALPDGSAYGKNATIGLIFSEFLKKFDGTLTKEALNEKIKNLSK